MERSNELIIYVNERRVLLNNYSQSKTLAELREKLEEEIPNNLSFLMNNSIISKENENNMTVKDITIKNNTVFVNQKYFKIYLDNELLPNNVDLLKSDSILKIISLLHRKLSKKLFYIKCEKNFIMCIDSSQIDELLSVNDILVNDSIYLFLNQKFNLKLDVSGFLIKRNGSISFEKIQPKNIQIFDSLILDESYDKYLKESNYEIRKKTSEKEYEYFTRTTKQDQKIIEKIIEKNNTIPNAIFDYLMLLKINKDKKFEKELKKYGYLLDIQKLKKLDSKFNNEQFNNYYDEKTNLINFLKKVIKSDYNSTQINLILSGIEYRDTLQAIINSPFISQYNRDNYINIPISISDNDLFFHYLRVKFFHFLGDAFDSVNMFQEYCKILIDKIILMNKEKEQKAKSKLLIEILYMISLYKCHSDEKTGVVYYYNNSENVSIESYYHPIVFFGYIRNILFEYFRMIANSKCMETALVEYKKTINNNVKKPAQLNIKTSFDYILRNIIFLPFFSNSHWGFTIPAFNLSFINIDIFNLQNNNNAYTDYSFLFYFVKYIISFIHEPIGHNLKIYESYNNNLETPFYTPRIIGENKNEKSSEGGNLMSILFGGIEKINIEHVLFLLNENNWALDNITFLERFKKIDEIPKIENCKSFIENGNMIKKLFSIFKINIHSIENAIQSGIKLYTYFNDKMSNELEIESIDEKHRAKKLFKLTKKQMRICLTHISY